MFYPAVGFLRGLDRTTAANEWTWLQIARWAIENPLSQQYLA